MSEGFLGAVPAWISKSLNSLPKEEIGFYSTY